MSEDILFRREGRIGIATLNRPQALNALNRAMCRAYHRKLVEWSLEPDVEAIVIEGAGDRAFCAGGDIRALHDHGRAGSPEWERFFFDEYRMNHAIAHCPKPHVALIDGITMGGGVGLSIHGRFRVATERTVFAMPETGIGLIPDVGGTHALPRLPGEIGTWLALTGERLGPAECRVAGIATHYVPSAELELLKERLAHSHEPVEQVLATFDADPGPDRLTALRDGIDYHFVHDTVDAILASLDGGDDWAQAQARRIRQMSPTSLKLSLYGVRAGRGGSLEDALKREFRMVSRIKFGHDFYEGVRAQLIDKDRAPRWNPARLEEVDIAPYLAEPLWGDLSFT
ncbi:MAG: enoyl-CoA hydratase/isomerase family protein [Sphingomonadaceae bacterium]|uniref:enoyl-CoA hydratase/isomerase family protein n=1 Tax=Thermaurantiacus sp. TaxID=2820283 RepID=UPI00298F0E7E|nr:enoyl-CoA hydratase/isomerase family protein [Thermaurantiacus sp.]MCS6986872.1 enoyl-CoA hydratase/isomerase family protein [Sphingomonadaceae bacterium]MDW8415528.1 enoyl-CoA hydratase/isomerase family protein [Thermaurantiacus sp.]